MFWVISEAHRNRGYAAEAGQALIDYAFKELHLGRIIATTEYDNLPSQAVMRKLGMALHRNPRPDPPWLQVVGLLELDGPNKIWREWERLRSHYRHKVII